jgi:hypothetical protein
MYKNKYELVFYKNWFNIWLWYILLVRCIITIKII